MSALLEIRELRVAASNATILDGFSLDVPEGSAVGVVGESGSGKSSAFLAALRLLPPALHVEAERLALRGKDLRAMDEKELRGVRGGSIALVFQDAAAALNPYLTIGRQLTEVAETHRGLRGVAAREEAVAALGAVALPDPRAALARYPHELSGGQKQRATIAMALLGRPALLIADEPTTALDPTVQAQVLSLLLKIREERRLSLVLISHDLGVVAGLADRVAVVYAGRVVEEAPVEELFAAPRHPYTAALLASAPTLHGPRLRRLPAIEGTPPSPTEPRVGCSFAPRCTRATDRCRVERPPETLEGMRRFVCFEPLR